MTQQMGEITESLGVFQAKGFAAVADGPVLAFFAERSFFRSRGTDAGCRVGNDSRSGSSATYLMWHVDSFQAGSGKKFKETPVRRSYHPRLSLHTGPPTIVRRLFTPPVLKNPDP